MKTLIAIALVAILGVSTAQAADTRTYITTDQQTIKYDANGPYGKQLISVEKQTVTTQQKNNQGQYRNVDQRTRSVATMIPLN